MIQPRAGKPDADHQRRGDVAQALVEIGTVLFGNGVQAVFRQLPARPVAERIEIADHGLGNQVVNQGCVRPTVGSHHIRGQSAGAIQGLCGDFCPANQGNGLIFVNNHLTTPRLPPIFETDHILTMK